MKAEVALLILNLSCADPQVGLRDFFSRYYVPPTSAGSFRWGAQGETFDSVFTRQLDAFADYAEYRIARWEKCR